VKYSVDTTGTLVSGDRNKDFEVKELWEFRKSHGNSPYSWEVCNIVDAN
jgi:predicted lipid-binding transport protein (Tim44 family)